MKKTIDKNKRNLIEFIAINCAISVLLQRMAASYLALLASGQINSGLLFRQYDSSTVAPRI